ncbi:hypothetical protein [Halorussus caseinilyticus]|uniref:Uncharacterized protein n=1 Tax=Halorussus caseinilyticus TaxID=3034025 RepID=A0ABD5WNE4_9EURY
MDFFVGRDALPFDVAVDALLGVGLEVECRERFEEVVGNRRIGGDGRSRWPTSEPGAALAD